jgi:hypothetical protein
MFAWHAYYEELKGDPLSLSGVLQVDMDNFIEAVTATAGQRYRRCRREPKTEETGTRHQPQVFDEWNVW